MFRERDRKPDNCVGCREGVANINLVATEIFKYVDCCRYKSRNGSPNELTLPKSNCVPIKNLYSDHRARFDESRLPH